MLGRLLVVVALALVGCQSVPTPSRRCPQRPLGQLTSRVSLREGRPVLVVACDGERTFAFASRDGRTWEGVTDPKIARSIEELEGEPAFIVSRDFDAENPQRGCFQLWRVDGLSRKIVATLPDTDPLDATDVNGPSSVGF